MFTVLTLPKTDTLPKTFQGSPKVYDNYFDALSAAQEKAAATTQNFYFVLEVKDKVYQQPSPVVVESVSLR